MVPDDIDLTTTSDQATAPTSDQATAPTSDQATAPTSDQATAPTSDQAVTDEKTAQLQAITASMNNATFDSSLPAPARNLTPAHTSMVNLVRFLLDHIPQQWRTDVEEAVTTFEDAVQQ